jgi:GNAT superfamily N-acetyltransferase
MLSVRPAEQAGGVGRGLLAHAEGFARERWGCSVMAMRVITTRAELLAWYERRGYRRTGRTEPFEPGDGAHFLQGPLRFERLEKSLRAS